MNDHFDTIYQLVMSSQLGHDMAMIKEDSPWHREDNVKEHTRMTLRWYDENCKNSRSPRQILLSKIALLFHDVGKPAARTEKFSEQRGVYYSYPGHELISARLFLDFMLSKMDEITFLSTFDVITIAFIIEHHLPFDKKDNKKLQGLKNHIVNFLGADVLSMFYDVIRSDSHGRISDDAETKYNAVEQWIQNFENIPSCPVYKSENSEIYPSLILLIGPSCCGKSTFASKLKTSIQEKNIDVDIHNWDSLRMQFYSMAKNEQDVNYNDAFWHAVNNSEEFSNFEWQKFAEMVKAKKTIILDNTNTSAKSRRKFITICQQAGYYITAIEFLTTLDLLKACQENRLDKKIDFSVSKKHFMSISTPIVGLEVESLQYYSTL